jgi:flagellar protein FlbD
MISVKQINGEPIIVNAAMIEFIESTPDTLLCLASGRKMMIRDSIDEVLEKITTYFKRIGHPVVVVPHSGQLLEIVDGHPVTEKG